MCTLLTVGAIGAFGAMLAMRNIVDKEVFSVETTLSSDYFEATEAFPEEALMGDVRFAFGITEVGYPDAEIPANVGTITAYYRTWDYSVGPDVTYKEIPSHPCTISELGLLPRPSAELSSALTEALGDLGDLGLPATSMRNGFYEPRDASTRKSLETYQNRLRCFDDPAVSLMGNH